MSKKEKTSSKGLFSSLDDDMEELIEELDASEIVEQDTKKVRKLPKFILAIILVMLTVTIGIYVYGRVQYNNKAEVIYHEATDLLSLGEYELALELYNEILEYKDSAEKVEECTLGINEGIYNEAIGLTEEGLHTEAIELFESIENYKDSLDKAEENRQTIIQLYLDEAGIAVYKLNKYKELAIGMCEVVYRDWKSAEEKGQDVKTTLNQTYTTWGENVSKLNSANSGLEYLMGELEVVGGKEFVYEEVTKLYDIYKKVCEQALDPTGESIDYKSKVDTYSKEFDAILEKLFSNEKEIKSVFERERQAEELANIQNEGKVIVQ